MRPSAPPIILAALATALAVVVLVLTEAYDPAGSAYAPVVLAILVAGHLPLLAGRDRPVPIRFPGARRAVTIAGVVALILVGGLFLLRGQREIYTTPVSPYANAQLGLMIKASERLDQQKPLYTELIDRGEFTQANSFPVGMIIPFTLAHKYGFEWRYASLAGVLLTLSLLAGGLALMATDRRNLPDVSLNAGVAAVVLCAAMPLLLPQVLPLLNWMPGFPLWAMMAALGLSLSCRQTLLAALFAGILAAMNPGWLLMLPLVAAHLWRQDKERFLVTLILMGLAPLLAYGAFRAQWDIMTESIVGSLFAEARSLEVEDAWRFASVTGVGDLFNLRPAIYVVGLALVGMLTWETSRRGRFSERLQLLALGGFVVIACGPLAYSFHWLAHGIWVAGLVPGVMTNGIAVDPKARRVLVLSSAGAAAVLMVAFAIQFFTRLPDTSARMADHLQPPTENLLGGFNVPSADHAWGRDTDMAIGLVLKRPQAGFLELDLATLGGDFTPYNPIVISVNGAPRGLYLERPGASSYARIPLRQSDLHRGFNIIELHARWARTIRSYNVADDPRTVTIIYEGLRFVPLRAQ
jgi:hypothetical protein